VSQAGAAPRLVLAANRAQAVNHVARKTISAQVAPQRLLVQLVSDGTPVEQGVLEEVPTLEDAIGSALSPSEAELAK
jgi:hypothetical protein